MNRADSENIRHYSSHQPELGKAVYIDPAATVIGRVKLGADVSVWPGTVIRGDVNHITIGARSNIQDLCCLHVTHAGQYNPEGYALSLGEGVTIGHSVVLHGCTIGDYCLVGLGAIVMDGAVLEGGSMVAAGSLVPPGARLESGVLYRGRPARCTRLLNDKEKMQLQYTADYYVTLKNQYLDSR